MPVSSSPRLKVARGPFELFVRHQARLGRILSASEMWLLSQLCRMASVHGVVSGKSFAYFAAMKGQSREWLRRLFRRLEGAGFVYCIGKVFYVRLADALSRCDEVIRKSVREVRERLARFRSAFVNSVLTIKEVKKEGLEDEGLSTSVSVDSSASLEVVSAQWRFLKPHQRLKSPLLARMMSEFPGIPAVKLVHIAL